MATQKQEAEHQLYKRENDLKKADAVAQIFESPESQLVQYPFKFPEIGDTEIRAKVVYTGLCASDQLYGRCKWQYGQTYPCCTGHEIVGIVTKLGKNVKKFKIGDVMGACGQRDYCGGTCDQCEKGNTNLCETKFVQLFGQHFGGFSTHIQIEEKMSFHIPDGLPLDKISPLFCAGITVYAPIARWAAQNPPSPKIKTAVIGIGGLGHLALQFLNKMGYHVTAFSTNLNRAEEYAKLGAHDTQHSTEQATLDKFAQKFDYVISTTYFNENDLLKKHLTLTRKNGTFTMVGLPHDSQTVNIDLLNLIVNQVKFEGSMIGSYKEVVEMLEFANKHKIHPKVEIFAFEDFNKALDKLENGRPLFRCVVDVQTWAKKNGFDK